MRILYETICIGIGTGILALLYIDLPSWPVAFFALWLAVSLYAGAAWSLFRHRQKIAQAKVAALREMHRRASRDRMAVTKPSIKLTSHMLTRLNVQRRLTCRPPLSPAGFYRSVQAAPNTVQNHSEWLLWMLQFEAHDANGRAWSQQHDAIPNSLEIWPDTDSFGRPARWTLC